MCIYKELKDIINIMTEQQFKMYMVTYRSFAYNPINTGHPLSGILDPTKWSSIIILAKWVLSEY